MPRLTEQRLHIAGPVGRALLSALLQRGWLEPAAKTRALTVTPVGRLSLAAQLGVVFPNGPGGAKR